MVLKDRLVFLKGFYIYSFITDAHPPEVIFIWQHYDIKGSFDHSHFPEWRRSGNKNYLVTSFSNETTPVERRFGFFLRLTVWCGLPSGKKTKQRQQDHRDYSIRIINSTSLWHDMSSTMEIFSGRFSESGQKCIVVNRQRLKNNIAIWSHCLQPKANISNVTRTLNFCESRANAFRQVFKGLWLLTSSALTLDPRDMKICCFLSLHQLGAA